MCLQLLKLSKPEADLQNVAVTFLFVFFQGCNVYIVKALLIGEFTGCGFFKIFFSLRVIVIPCNFLYRPKYCWSCYQI